MNNSCSYWQNSTKFHAKVYYTYLNIILNIFLNFMNIYYFSPHCPFWPGVPVYSSLPYPVPTSPVGTIRYNSLRIPILLTFRSNSSRTRPRSSSLLPRPSPSPSCPYCLLTLLFSHHWFDCSINYIDAPYVVFVNYLQHWIKNLIYKFWCKLYLVVYFQEF